MALKGAALTLHYTAWDTAANAGKAGDAANHTLRVIKDGVAAAPTNAPEEVDATNAPGVYRLALTAEEMTAESVSVAGKSATSGVAIIPVHVTTEGGRLDAAVTSRLADGDYTAPDNAGIGTAATAAAAAANSAATAASEASAANTKLGTPAGASVSADIAAVKTDTGTLLTRIPAALFSGITSLASWLRLLARKDTPDATAKNELNANGGSYEEATDSLQGQTDTGGAGLTAAQIWSHDERTVTMTPAQLEAAVRGTKIVFTRGVRNSLTLTDLGSLADHTDVLVTVKADPKTEEDEEAILQFRKTVGLVRLNGAEATAGDGSLTADEEAESVTIVLEADAAAQLVPVEKLQYDVKVLFASGPLLRTKGRCDIEADVTRAVS